MSRAPWAGMATSIGSLPHVDPVAATEFILRLHPSLPAAPQLPQRSPQEAMIAQALAGIPGIQVSPDGRVTVKTAQLDPLGGADGEFTEPHWSGYHAFIEAIADRSGPVKFQLTGALTLTLALMTYDVPEQLAFAVARAAVLARAHSLRRLVDERLPGAAVMVFVDEPALVTTAPEALPVERRPAIDALGETLSVFGKGIATGVHCCGSADWRYALPAKPDVVSFPVGGALAPNAWPLREHLRNGGCIAWGVVPTAPPYEFDLELLWKQLDHDWSVLIDSGCDPLLLRSQALITPACGLVGMSIADAERALRACNSLAARL